MSQARALENNRVVVAGLGLSGLAAVRLLLACKAQVVGSDSRRLEDFGEAILEQLLALETQGLRLELGEHRRESFVQADLVVKSPGIPPSLPPIAQARAAGVPVIGEVELCAPWLQAPVVAISGTNGKSTTTALVGHLLRCAGRKPFVGGNLGTPVAEQVLQGEAVDAVVLELSSYQIDDLSSFRADIAVLLNLSPDHLERYGSLEAYAESKASLLNHLHDDGVLVLGVDSPHLRALAARLKKGQELVPFGVRSGSEASSERELLSAREASRDLEAASDLDASRVLDDASALDASSDLGAASELGTSRDLGASSDLEAASALDASSDLETTSEADASSDLGDQEAASDLDASRDLGAASDLDASSDLGTTSEPDASSDLESSGAQEAASDLRWRVLQPSSPALLARGSERYRIEAPSLRGSHNLENAMAAIEVARRLGASSEQIQQGLNTFPGLPHRLESIARHQGVEWINDSKATNVDSVEKSLTAFSGPLHLIMGGKGKRASYRALGRLVQGRVRELYVIGEDAPTIEKELSEWVSVHRAGTLERAVEMASSRVKPGECVLLAPGCASFDQFKSFEERGNCFRRLVEQVVAGGGNVQCSG